MSRDQPRVLEHAGPQAMSEILQPQRALGGWGFQDSGDRLEELHMGGTQCPLSPSIQCHGPQAWTL